MKVNVVISMIFGFFTSMVGSVIIEAMFKTSSEARMKELSSYAAGMIGWYYPFVRWVEWYVGNHKDFKPANNIVKSNLLRQSLLTAFIINSFCFGVAVIIAGIVRVLLVPREGK